MELQRIRKESRKRKSSFILNQSFSSPISSNPSPSPSFFQSSAMAATTMAILNVKCFKPPTTKAASLLPTPTLPKGLAMSTNLPPLTLSATVIAGAVFSTLSTCEPAMAVQQIAEIAEGGDNRGLALLLPLIPAIAWVLFNILQPALNQINRMRSAKGLIAGLGLGALGASSGFIFTPEASAAAAEASAGDNRGQLLLIVVAPAILWVLYNILQPALNQINKMRNE